MESKAIAGEQSPGVHVKSEVEDVAETGQFIEGRGGFLTSAGMYRSHRGRVTDESPHSLLVGEGAVAFAQDQDFPLEPNESLLMPHMTRTCQGCLIQGFLSSPLEG
ncbi:N(4)-(Beta-N-acetylglucosaminyl)-L-asparaginase-like [Arapaima gigas]